jgi:tripartite-type tricarboxylate transporter receptor subunit TctC
VLSGETSVYFAPLANALSLVRQGRLRPLAVTSTKRLPLLPDQPTVADSGYAGYESGFWHGIMVPMKASQDVIATIHNATVKTLNSPPIAKRLHDLGYVPVGSRPEEFGAYIRSEIQKLSRVLRGLKVTAE